MSIDTPPRTGTGAAGSGTGTAGTGFWSASRLVAEREIRAYLHVKGVWITFGLFVVGVFAAAILPGIFGGDDDAPTVATVGPEAAQVVAGTELSGQPAADLAEAEQLVRAGEVDAAVVPDPAGESPLGVRVVALDDEPSDVVAALSTAPPVDLLDPASVSEGARWFVSFLFALAFFVFAMFGVAIAQSVVTEKQTRIVEILVATVPVRALLAGKIAGHSVLVLAQVGILALLAPLALRAGGHTDLIALLAPALGWFVPFFILGFVLLAGMWAVAGSLVSQQEDLGSSTTLVAALIMLPYFGVIFLQNNPVVMTVMSYVPFSAAVAMPVRMFAGDAQLWEPFVAMAGVAAALVVCLLVAARLYEGSLLQVGAKVRLRQAWSQARS